MAALNDKELAVLGKFREAIQAEGLELTDRQKTDMSLIAWLREKDLNVPKALEMLKKNCIWRKEEDMENILSWKPPKSYGKMYPYEICGRCTKGCPVLVMPFGKWDIRKCVDAGEKNLWLRYVDQMISFVIEDMYKVNASRKGEETPVSQCIFIVDWAGFSFRQVASVSCVQTYLECVNRYKSNYPDLLKAGYYINAPKAFSVFFSIIKPVMPVSVLSRLEIFTSNQLKWKPALLTHISSDQLPIALGGTNSTSCNFLSAEYSYKPDGQNQNVQDSDSEEDEKIANTILAGGPSNDGLK